MQMKQIIATVNIIRELKTRRLGQLITEQRRATG